MLLPRYVVGVFSICVVGLAAGLASGQEYPAKPIRIISSTPMSRTGASSADVVTNFPPG